MAKIDSLLKKAKPQPSILDRLEKDNPYMEMTSIQLLDLLDGNNYQAPDMRTWEWQQFMHAMVHSASEGGLTE